MFAATPDVSGVLALAEDVVAGTVPLAGSWWWTPASPDPTVRLGWAWSLARVPGVAVALAYAAPIRPGLLVRAARIGEGRRRSWALPSAPILAAGHAPAAPPGMIRVPHLAGSQVLWEIVPEQSAERLLGHPVPDTDVRRHVERDLDRILTLVRALAAGRLPDGITDPLLSGWADNRLSLDIGVIYRHWSRIHAALPPERQLGAERRRRVRPVRSRAVLQLVRPC
ncbi:hypothetical protein AB0M43_24100 [Longispora sp. NPDC051575]|uniref:hypothetical protein n=1 Tax=Longispora sp. NPDC051575 TaxID=3154943 RepID=UPI0034421D59